MHILLRVNEKQGKISKDKEDGTENNTKSVMINEADKMLINVIQERKWY